MPTKTQTTSNISAQTIFNKVYDWQLDAKHEQPQHAVVKGLSNVLVTYACFKALWDPLSTISYKKTETRKGVVAFVSVDMAYLSGLHQFIARWQDERTNSELKSQRSYHRLLKDVVSFLPKSAQDTEVYDPIYVRNNCTEANKIYVCTFTDVADSQIDTSSVIQCINANKVAEYLPELLSNDPKPNKPDDLEPKFFEIIANCMYPDIADKIQELYVQRFATKESVCKKFSKFIKVVLDEKLIFQADLGEIALYYACVIYFFDQELATKNFYKALREAMGNALVVFRMNREVSAFGSCWGNDPKGTETLKHRCLIKWKDLATRQDWASSFYPNFEYKADSDLDLSKVDYLRLRYSQLSQTQAISGNATATVDESSKSYGIIEDFIASYDRHDPVDDKGENDCIRAFYAIDWHIISELLCLTKDNSEKPSKNETRLAELQNIEDAIKAKEGNETPKLVQDVVKICDRVFSSKASKEEKKVTPEESAKLLSFLKKYEAEIKNKSSDLSKTLRKQAGVIQSGNYDDLTVALTSIVLDVLSTSSTSGEPYIKALKLKIKLPFDKCRDKDYVLALSFFSMMYGPLLQALREIRVGNQALFEFEVLPEGNNAGTKERSNEAISADDLIHFVEWYASSVQKQDSWWYANQTCSKSAEISLLCVVELTVVYPNQQDEEGEREFRQEFTWKFNKHGLGNVLSIDVTHLLGIDNPNDFERFELECNHQKQEPFQALAEDDASEALVMSSSAPHNCEPTAMQVDNGDNKLIANVLRHAYFRYNFYGFKGEYQELALDNTATLIALEKDKNTGSCITFDKSIVQADNKEVQSKANSHAHTADEGNGNDMELLAFIEKKLSEVHDDTDKQEFAGLLKSTQSALVQFASCYRQTLWQFLQGKLMWQQVSVCAQKYEHLLNICCKAYHEHNELKDNKDDTFRTILYQILRIGIADEIDETFSHYKPVAIACPWHIEGLKTIALKNKRVVDFVRSIRACSLDSHQPAHGDDRIDLSSCNFKLFGKEGLIKLLQSPIALEVVLPTNSDYSKYAFLYRTQCCQGYALYEQNKMFSQADRSLDDIQCCPIYPEEMKIIREQFIRLLSSFEFTKNELNILFWQCPNYNLPLELFCSCLTPEMDNSDNTTLADLFAPYHHVSFYVIGKENADNEQKMRLFYESRLRSFLSVNQSQEKQHIVNNKFSIIVASPNLLNKLNVSGCGQEQFFDLCLCYDIFSTEAKDYQGGMKPWYEYKEQKAEDDFLVNDERFFPAFYTYQSPKSQNWCCLIAPFYTSTLRQILRAFNVIINGSYNSSFNGVTKNLAMPYIAKPNKLANVLNTMNTMHTYSSLVVICDRLLSDQTTDSGANTDSDATENNKPMLFHFKRESSIERNVSISVKDSNIKEQLLSKLKRLLCDEIWSVEQAQESSHPEDDEDYLQDKLESMQKRIYEHARKLSGSIMLKAHQHSNTRNEMVGLVLTQFILEQCRKQLIRLYKDTPHLHFMGPVSLMVDDYVHFLGLDEGNRADILTVEIIEQEANDDDQDPPYKVICFVAESKFYQTLQSGKLGSGESGTVARSIEQLQGTVTSLAHNLSRQNEDLSRLSASNTPMVMYYDRELFRQRFAELLFERMYNARNTESGGYGEKLKKFVTGNFEAEIYGISCCFGYAAKNENSISFKCLEDAQDKEAKLGGSKIKWAVVQAEGNYVKELLKLFNDDYVGMHSNEFFKSLRGLLVSEDNATPVTAEAVDRAFHDFGLAPLASSANVKYKP